MTTDALGLVGKRIREYEVLEIIGRGGMGAVYRAKHVLLQEDRAIKVVSRKPADDHEFIERFIREARVLARLKDEHLVRLYEFWEHDGQLFMALEFLRGESVAHRLQARTRLSVEETVGIARQAAQGLKVAHEGNVVHRDISPDNLQMVKGEAGAEVVKVMDFGIAKALEEVQRELTANLFLGKFEYASPEQCGYGLEEGETIDHRTDIYSLGVTIFKMVTGGLPFNSATPHGYLVKHATETPPPPSSLVANARIPPELDRLVLRALAKKRGERPQSMTELIRELDAIPTGERTNAAASTLVAVLPSPGSVPRSPSPSPASTSVPTASQTAALKIGESFARKYVIKGRLGEGGMGVVYRAVDTILDEPVALKVISQRILEGRDSVERLKREVVLARRVSHPNVCRIYDIGESDAGMPYVSMELIDGKTLGVVLNESGALTLSKGIPLIRQVLDALGAAHHVNVIHRDLKPDNIMVTRDGHAVIMDFGLSLSEDSHRVTRAGLLIGTPNYMAPEQATGAPVDPRSDLYAVGVILFRMLTGRLPFASSNMLEILRAHRETAPPRPSELNPSIPPALESIILKALEKDPARRFASAESFLTALDPVEPAQRRTSTESGRVVRVPSTARHRFDDAAPTAVSPVPPVRTTAKPDVPPKRPLDPDLEKVRAFMAGGPRVPDAAAALAPTIAGGEPLPTREIERTRSAGVPARALPGEPPARRPRPALPPHRGVPWPAVGGAAAALAVASTAWYFFFRPTVELRPSRAPTSSSEPMPSPQVQPSPLLPPPVAGPTPAPPPSTPATPKPSPVTTARPTPLATPPPTMPTPTAPTTPPPTPVPPPTAPPTPPAASPAGPKPVGLSPEQGVREALRSYALAFSRLDKAAVRMIFPTVPDKNFEGLGDLKAYQMDIEVAKMQVDPPRVIVETRTRHTYTSFSGKQESRTLKEKMVFIESKDGAWVRVQ